MICFYHNDLDGRCAAHWVWRIGGLWECRRFVPVNYRLSAAELLKQVEPNEQVFILDYSLPLEAMHELLWKTRNVIWIDHHISAIEKYELWSGPQIPGARVDSVAACVLTYLYLFVWTSHGSPPTVVQRAPTREEWLEVPKFTVLVGDRDAWRWEDVDTRYFCAGLEAHDTDPQSPTWFDAEENVPKYVAMGKVVEKFKSQMWRQLLADYAFEVSLNGFKGLACNVGYGSSSLFEVLDPEALKEYDFFVAFVWDGNQYEVSLYTNRSRPTPVNVAQLAEHFGGGGHFGAAGFECQELPFKVLGRAKLG